MAQKISIVLPAYNEEKNIKHTVASIADFFSARQLPYEILIVDDGSNDATSKIARSLHQKNPSISLLRNGDNIGKGASVKRGVLAATGDLIAFLDSDGSTPIAELEKFFPAIEQGYQIAIGSRYMQTSTIVIKQPWFRVLVGRLGNLLIQLLLLPGIIDTQCGCKMFTRKAALAIFPRQRINRWGFDMEILAIARSQGFKIKEMPVSWYDSTSRTSRFRPLKDAGRTILELAAIKWNFLLGRYR